MTLISLRAARSARQFLAVAVGVVITLSSIAPVSAGSVPPEDAPPGSEEPDTSAPESDTSAPTPPEDSTNPPDTNEPPSTSGPESTSGPGSTDSLPEEASESTPAPEMTHGTSDVDGSGPEEVDSSEPEDLLATAAPLALPSPLPPPTCHASWPVRVGSTGQPALCVEQRLVQLGYLPAGTADSTFDSAAADALRLFEAEAGITVDGVADLPTLSTLGIYRPPAATPPSTCHVWYFIRAGSTGRPAECLERRLAQLGYAIDGPDGIFDGASVNELRRYQFHQGLPITGVADGTTLARLRIWTSAPAMPPSGCHVWTAMERGDQGRPTLCLERRLAQLGFTITPDSTFDGPTVNAVRAFQYREGLPTTGVADSATLIRLRIWTTRPATPAPTCYVSMEVGPDTPGRVADCVERRLVQLGYSLAGPDPRFDATAAAALRSYQYFEGLPATGRADRATLVSLRLWRAPVPLPAPTCRVHNTVRISAIGTEARCLESRLQQLGFATGPVDQTFDAVSAAGLRSFQYNNGLVNNGVADRATLERLGIYSAASVGPAPVYLPANSGSGRRVVYSRAQQRIWVVEADGSVVKTHRVSGRTYEPYAGTYYVYSRSLYTYSANDPSVRWRYMIRFTYGFQGGRIGFHEIPNRNGVPLQSREQLGLPLSAGCVRQSTADAQWLWNWAYVGTKVVVL